MDPAILVRINAIIDDMNITDSNACEEVLMAFVEQYAKVVREKLVKPFCDTYGWSYTQVQHTGYFSKEGEDVFHTGHANTSEVISICVFAEEHDALLAVLEITTSTPLSITQAELGGFMESYKEE